MPKSYVSLAQLKDPGWLGNVTDDYDTTLLRILENASEEVDHLTFRHYDCWEGVQYFDGSSRVLLPNEDILSITSIDLDMDGSGNYATSVTASNYLMYPLGGPDPYPKTKLVFTLASGIGYWASGIPAGVKITGVFGSGNGRSATPYHLTGVTGTVGTASGTSLTLSAEGTIQAGNTIRIGSEQCYVSAVSNNGTKTATITRGANGTTAAIHSTATISVYEYPGPVVESTLILTTNWWKQRENPTIFKAGNSVTGEYEITEDIEKILTKRLNHHIRRHLV